MTRDPFGTGALRRAVTEAWRASPTRFREDANSEEDHARGYYRDRVVVEQGTPLEAMIPALTARGHRVSAREPGYKANAIERAGGRWVGAADPRSEGVAIDTAGTVTQIRRAVAVPNRPPE